MAAVRKEAENLSKETVAIIALLTHPKKFERKHISLRRLVETLPTWMCSCGI